MRKKHNKYITYMCLSFFLFFPRLSFGLDTVVDFGGQILPLHSNTACNNNPDIKADSTCDCCLIKHEAHSGVGEFKKALNYCVGKKNCPANSNLRSESAIIDRVETLRKNDLIPHVSINRELLEKGTGLIIKKGAGILNDQSTIAFLRNLSELGYLVDSKKLITAGESCLEMIKRDGGAQTLQLILVQVKSNCPDSIAAGTKGKIVFIIKEMKKPFEEVTNLAKIERNPVLKPYIYNAHLNTPKNTIGIALPYVNAVYKDQKSDPHYMAVLVPAPGDPGKKFLERLSELNPKSEAFEKEKVKVQTAFNLFGVYFGKFQAQTAAAAHLKNGVVIAHGDLHLDNFFIDVPTQRVTLIDAETMALTMTNGDSEEKDLIRLFAHSTSRYFGKSSTAEKFEDVKVLSEVFFEPFLSGYDAGYTSVKGASNLDSLRTRFANANLVTLLRTQSTLYNSNWDKYKTEVVRVMDNLIAKRKK